MSSKLIRADDSAQQQISVWRPAGSGMAPAQAAPSAEVERQMEARLRVAYQDGLSAGDQAARRNAAEQAAQRMEPAIASLNAVVEELASSRKRFRTEAEEDTVKLAVSIARRVLRRELCTDPDAILGLVKAAFQKLNARETHRLRVSKADESTVREHRDWLDLPPAVEISADASLPPGSAIFETSRGELDASVDTQLSEIERGFTDIIRRRAK